MYSKIKCGSRANNENGAPAGLTRRIRVLNNFDERDVFRAKPQIRRLRSSREYNRRRLIVTLITSAFGNTLHVSASLNQQRRLVGDGTVLTSHARVWPWANQQYVTLCALIRAV